MVAQRFFFKYSLGKKLWNFEKSIFSFSINSSNFTHFAYLLIKAIHFSFNILFLHAVILFSNTHKVQLMQKRVNFPSINMFPILVVQKKKLFQKPSSENHFFSTHPPEH